MQELSGVQIFYFLVPLFTSQASKVLQLDLYLVHIEVQTIQKCNHKFGVLYMFHHYGRENHIQLCE